MRNPFRSKRKRLIEEFGEAIDKAPRAFPTMGEHGGTCIAVHMDAAEAEMDAWAAAHPHANDTEIKAAVRAAFENPANWMRGEWEDYPPDARFGMFEIDLDTGEIIKRVDADDGADEIEPELLEDADTSELIEELERKYGPPGA